MDPFKKKLKELCVELIETDEFKAFLKAEIEMKKDSEAMDLVKQFTDAQLEIQKMAQQGQEPDQTAVSKAQQLEKEMTGDSTIVNYMKSQEEFNELMSIINEMLNESIKIATKKAYKEAGIE